MNDYTLYRVKTEQWRITLLGQTVKQDDQGQRNLA